MAYTDWHIPMPYLMSVTLDDRIRFWNKLKQGQPDECWPWLAQTINGYGRFALHGKGYYANRVAYFLEYKKDPGHLHVLHSCDNRVCCNPKHLDLGTQHDNMQDKIDKARQHVGSLTGNAKLDETDIPVIRQRLATGEHRTTIARSYGVDKQTIRGIDIGRTWRHVI